MLDFADVIVLNKFEKRGAEDALRDVRKQWRRNHPERARLAGRSRCRCFRPSRAASTIRASIACSSSCARRSRPARRADAQSAQWEPDERRADAVRVARSADSGLAHSLPRGDRRRTAGARRQRCAARGGSCSHRRSVSTSRCAPCTMRRLPAPLDRYPDEALNDRAGRCDAARAACCLQPRARCDRRRGRRRAQALAAARQRSHAGAVLVQGARSRSSPATTTRRR